MSNLKDGLSHLQSEACEANNHATRFFDENMAHPKATALDAPKFPEFDWEGLSKSLGEAQEISENEYERMADAVATLFRWVAADYMKRKGGRRSVEEIGRRAIALLWTIDPRYFQGKSAAAVARHFKLEPVRLAEITGEVSRKFGIRNRAQDHAGNFKPNQ